MKAAIEIRNSLHQRLEGLSLEAWTQIKPSLLEELHELPVQVLRDVLESTPLKRNITVRDARVRVLCSRAIRRKKTESQQAARSNPLFGRF